MRLPARILVIIGLWVAVAVAGTSVGTSIVTAQDPLTETYISPDGGTIRFQYPTGWTIDQNDYSTFLYSNAADIGHDPSLGNIQITIPNPVSYWAMMGHYEDLETQVDVDIRFSSAEFGEPEALTLNNQPAFLVEIIRSDADFFMLYIDSPTGNLVLMISTAEGEGDQLKPLFLQVAATLTYNPIDIEADNARYTIPTTGTPVWQVTGELDGSTAAGTELEHATDVAVGEGDILYIANGTAGIVVLDADGQVTDVWPAPSVEGQALNIIKVAVAPDGTIWVVDIANLRLHQLDQNGNFLQSVGKVAEPFHTGERGEFDRNGPVDIAIAPDGTVYALNESLHNESRLLSFSPDGVFIDEFTVNESFTPGALSIAVGPSSDLYVAGDGDNLLGNVFQYSPTGQLIGRTAIPFHNLQLERNIGGTGALLILEDGSFWTTDNITGTLNYFGKYGQLLISIGEGHPNQNPPVPYPSEVVGTTLESVQNGLARLSNGDLVLVDFNGGYSQVMRVALE